MKNLFSQNCLICKQSSRHLVCEYCKTDLTFFDCGKYQHNLMLWPKVQKGLPKVDFDSILALSAYQWPISNMLTSLKFSAKLPAALAMASLFNDQCLATLANKPELIVPIPLHKNRYLWRKYNQSIEIAKHISRLSHIPLHTGLIERSQPTRPQTGLTAAQRHKNLRHAFSLHKQALEQLNHYQRIVLFDDVVTTGTTVNLAYKLIKQQYPHLKIDVWCIAITLVDK